MANTNTRNRVEMYMSKDNNCINLDSTLSVRTYNCECLRNSRSYISVLKHVIIIMYPRDLAFST